MHHHHHHNEVIDQKFINETKQMRMKMIFSFGKICEKLMTQPTWKCVKNDTFAAKQFFQEIKTQISSKHQEFVAGSYKKKNERYATLCQRILKISEEWSRNED